VRDRTSKKVTFLKVELRRWDKIHLSLFLSLLHHLGLAAFFFVAWFLHCTYMKSTCAIQNIHQVQNVMHTFFVFKKCLCILTLYIFFNLQILSTKFRYPYLGQNIKATINGFVLNLVLAKNKRAERTSETKTQFTCTSILKGYLSTLIFVSHINGIIQQDKRSNQHRKVIFGRPRCFTSIILKLAYPCSAGVCFGKNA